jgi:osmotically-inducible protein OsmY
MPSTRWPRLVLAALALLNGGCAAAVVAGGATTAVVMQDRRALGVQLEDEKIEHRIGAAVRDDPALAGKIHLGVTSYNGVVLLTGEAAGTEWRDRAQAKARDIPGVRRVVNEIRVSAADDGGAVRQDNWLATRVRTRLINTRELDSGYVTIVADNGVVYLLGLVTRPQADLATEASRTVEGVQRIVKLFEYVE